MTFVDVAFLADSDGLEPALEPLMKTSPGNAVWVPETVRLRYAYSLAKRGDTARSTPLVDEAERVARDRIAKGDQMPDVRVELAAVSALRRDHDSAIEWLSRAYEGGYRHYGLLERDPILAPLAGDRRFRDILDRMRRDLEVQRQRAQDRGLLDLDALLAPPK
jgi:hypothetical protein